MADQYNKFNSKSGFEFNIDNVLSEIRLDFDTNVENPNNYILGLNAEQDEFVLIDPNLINNTNQTENTFDLAIQDFGVIGKVNNYIFEKLVDPSIVGCSNCVDSDSNVIRELFTNTGDLPLINREVIAEFEVNPNAIHSLEIELIGHRKICDDNGNCFDDTKNWMTDYISEYGYLDSKPLYISGSNAFTNLNDDTKKSLFNFIDYSCCPCCESYSMYLNGQIGEGEYKAICEDSNKYIKVDGVSVLSFESYCTRPTIKYVDEFEQNKQPELIRTISMCELIEKTKENYGSGIDPTLLNCSVVTNKLLEILTPQSQTSIKNNKEEQTPNYQTLLSQADPHPSGCTGCTVECDPDAPCQPNCQCETCVDSEGVRGSLCCNCGENCCCDQRPDGPGCDESIPSCSGTSCQARCSTVCPIIPNTNIPCCCPDSPCTCEQLQNCLLNPDEPCPECSPPPPTTTLAPPPTTTTTGAPTTPPPPPVLGYKCSLDAQGQSICVEVTDEFEPFICQDTQEICCEQCNLPHHCDPRVDPPVCVPYDATNPTCRIIYANRGLCLKALVEDPDNVCKAETVTCDQGKCKPVDDCTGEYRTIQDCRQGIQKDPTAPISLCGKYNCTSSQQTCQECQFIVDTSVGFDTKQQCNQQTLCNKPTFNCNETKTCPDGRQLLGTCDEICTGGEFSNKPTCQASGCETTSYGNRWRCFNKECQFVDICDDPTPQQFPSRSACQLECGDFNCVNNLCQRLEGPGQFPPDIVNGDLNCLADCECVWFLQKGEYTDSGCPECKRVCGPHRRIESTRRGPCSGCDSKGRGCRTCVDTFSSQVECENLRATRNLIPHTCVGATCIPTSSYDPLRDVNCGQYCSKQECESVCAIPSGYSCISIGLEKRCKPEYCGNRGDFPSRTSCEEACSTTEVCGYNCVPQTNNPKINVCKSACIATDADQTPGTGRGEFRTYAMCKNMCLSDYGWVCKGNNCVRGDEATGPGQYETYSECVQRCIIPNQAPCGVAPRKVRT